MVEERTTSCLIEIKGDEKFLTDPQSDEGQFQNLLLNMMGGLEYEHLTQEEKDLCARHGYKPE